MYKIIIYGKVQGVGYRVWLKKIAKSLKIKGYVYNKDDGLVEAVVVCSKSELIELVRLCYTGPNLSKVEKIEYFERSNYSLADLDSEFYIKYSI